MTKIVVPEGMTYPAELSEYPNRVPDEACRLKDPEFAAATARFPGENIADLMRREIGSAPEQVVFLGMFFHDWFDTCERPGGHRTDLIFLHVAKVSEMEIKRIVLDPNEYDVDDGFLRFRGATRIPVRPVIRQMYARYKRLLFEQPKLFVR